MAVNSDREYRVEGSHWVSPVNFDAEVTDQYDFPTPLGLISSTLRKVRYTAGATTTMDGFLRIAAALESIGIRDESLNLDWWGDDGPNPGEFELVREVLAGGFGFTTNVYADTLLGNGTTDRDGRRTVDLLLGLGARVIAPGIVEAPDDDAQVRQFEQLTSVVGYAQNAGLGVTVTLAQCGRRDFARMVRAANEAIDLGVTRLDLMDSTSSLGPEAMRVFIRRFRASLAREVPLTMHVHDDFGLGTAAAIAAAAAGAGPDVSVNGASYRCGFPPLDEVVSSLEVLYGVDTGIDVARLQWISDLVAGEMGLPLPALKPVVGGYAFLKHTPGDVLAALAGGVDQFPPISGCVHASVIGGDARWVWDSLSSRAMARQLAANLGLPLTDEQVLGMKARLDAAVKARTEYPRWITPDEVERIAHAYAAEAGADDTAGLGWLNSLTSSDAVDVLRECVKAADVAGLIVAGRPFSSVDQVIADAGRAIDGLPDEDAAAVLDGLPALSFEGFEGEGLAARWSHSEQSGIRAADAATRAALDQAIAQYRDRFGMTYVIAANGRSAAEVLDDLNHRLRHDPATELATARGELKAIAARRLRALFADPSAALAGR